MEVSMTGIGSKGILSSCNGWFNLVIHEGWVEESHGFFTNQHAIGILMTRHNIW